MTDANDIAEQFEKHLSSPRQSWLLGAGISFEANIPLMIPLTDRVMNRAKTETFKDDEEALKVVEFIQAEIAQDAHIEIFLTHLCDFNSLAIRTRDNCVSIGEAKIHIDKLTKIHKALLALIAETLRWGYRVTERDDGEPPFILEGKVGHSIIDINSHVNFMQALFNSRRAGLDKLREPVHFFTTNYDTLLEDALSLNHLQYDDGFSGGAVGFWTGFNEDISQIKQAYVTKLHGSIDWCVPVDNPSSLIRVRYGDKYSIQEEGTVMIYPQSIKYMHAQQDPFLRLFQRFRERLANTTDHVLLISGYSFGDDHINADIDEAMSPLESQLIIVAFTDEPNGELPPKLREWRDRSWGGRVYIASPKGLYRGNDGPVFPLEGNQREWWHFQGLTELLSSGFPADILEKLQ